MRADEYLVEEIIKLKKENEELKEKNIDLSLQLVNLNKSNENDIILNKKLIKIYNVGIYDYSWKIVNKLISGVENLEKIKEALENDEKLDELWFIYGIYDKEKMYTIKESYVCYKIENRDEKLYLDVKYNENNDKGVRLSHYVFYGYNSFENYEEALEYARKESREFLNQVIKDYEKEKK